MGHYAGELDGSPGPNHRTLKSNRWRHKIRGTTYRVLYEAAKASSIIAALDEMTMVVYQGEADGLIWVRPAIEFFDGRFERLPDTPTEHRG